MRWACRRGGDWARYHHVLSRASWSSLDVSRVLLEQLVQHLVPTGPLHLAIDETLERRWSPKIEALRVYWDPVRSSHGHFVKAKGLRWVSLMLLANVPCTPAKPSGMPRPCPPSPTSWRASATPSGPDCRFFPCPRPPRHPKTPPATARTAPGRPLLLGLTRSRPLGAHTNFVQSRVQYPPNGSGACCPTSRKTTTHPGLPRNPAACAGSLVSEHLNRQLDLRRA